MDLIPIVFLFAVMYLVLIRPQQQRARNQRATIAALTVGDDVVTIGGVLGRIVRLDDDTAEIETTPGTVLRYRRTAISTRITPAPTTTAAATPEDADDENT